MGSSISPPTSEATKNPYLNINRISESNEKELEQCSSTFSFSSELECLKSTSDDKCASSCNNEDHQSNTYRDDQNDNSYFENFIRVNIKNASSSIVNMAADLCKNVDDDHFDENDNTLVTNSDLESVNTEELLQSFSNFKSSKI
jgi:hypothetical protein